MNQSNYKNWILAFRPKTLTAAVVPIFVATALVAAINSVSAVIWWVSILALLASLFIQIATNLVNDASDFKKGADTSERIGPQRVTQSGLFTHKQVMTLAAFFFTLAVICGAPLVIKGGIPILLIGLLSLVCGYAYTAGPFPLAYKGLGDLFVIIFFGLIAVAGLVYIHSGVWTTAAWVAGFQVGLHCTALIAVNNLRDIEGDAKVRKNTLPVRFGINFARFEIAFLAYFPFLLGAYWFVHNWYWVSLLPLFALPLANRVVFGVFQTKPSAEYNKFLAQAAGLHLLTGALMTTGLIIHSWIK